MSNKTPAGYKNYGTLQNGRVNFSKISGTTPLPNLVEIQTSSFQEFLDHGLDEVFRECFPIANYSNTAEIAYAGFRFEKHRGARFVVLHGDQSQKGRGRIEEPAR